MDGKILERILECASITTLLKERMISQDFFYQHQIHWIFFFPPIPLSRPSKPAWVEPVKVPFLWRFWARRKSVAVAVVNCLFSAKLGGVCTLNDLLIPHFLLICECSGCKRMVFCQDWILLHQFQHCFVWMPDLNFPKNAWQLCGVLVPNGRFQAVEKEAWCAQSQVPGLDAQQKKSSGNCWQGDQNKHTHIQLQLVGHFCGWNNHGFCGNHRHDGSFSPPVPLKGTLEGNCGHQAEGACLFFSVKKNMIKRYTPVI